MFLCFVGKDKRFFIDHTFCGYNISFFLLVSIRLTINITPKMHQELSITSIYRNLFCFPSPIYNENLTNELSLELYDIKHLHTDGKGITNQREGMSELHLVPTHSPTESFYISSVTFRLFLLTSCGGFSKPFKDNFVQSGLIDPFFRTIDPSL